MVKVDVRGANPLTLPDVRSGGRVADVTSAVIGALAAPLGTRPLQELHTGPAQPIGVGSSSAKWKT